MIKKRLRNCLQLLFILLICSDTQGDPPQLIQDISGPVVAIGSVGSFTSANGLTFMTGTSVEEGTELWFSDGTEEGTQLLKDICVGIEDSSPTDLVEMNGICYFAAHDNVNGRELWESDGTPEGTTLVKDVFPGLESSDPKWFIVVEGILYFMADDGIHGNELWRSDGSSVGTWMVKDINLDGDGGYDYYNAVMNGKLYFCARDSVGVGLWATDGTEGNTEKLMAGACSYITSAGNRLFFSCNGELYWSDGTPAGSGLLKDINSSGSSYPRYFTLVGNIVFFTAKDSYGNELWKVDPLTGHAEMVKNLVSGDSYPENLTNVNGTLYFQAKWSGYPKYLWKSDGTASGTVLISAASECYAPSYMTWYNNKVYFTASHAVYGYEVFCYDEGTDTLDVLTDVTPDNPGGLAIYPYNLTKSNDKLFFTVRHSLTTDRKLYSSDGSQAGTEAIGTFWQSDNWGSNPFGFVEFQDMVYFSARTLDFGLELWKTNCMDITEMVKDIMPGSPDGIVSNRFYPFEDFMLFEGNDGSGPSLWKTDGSQAGTVKVYDVDVNSSFSSNLLQTPQDFIPFQDAIYFCGYENQQSSGIWKTDGTTDGTVQVYNEWTCTQLVKSGDTLYFSSTDPNHGTELWKSDGTEAGTQIVKDIVPGTSSSYPYYLCAVQNKIVFQAEEQPQITKLLVSDGTEAGTSILKDFRPGERFDGYMIGEYKNELYFISNDGIDAVGLWKTDGTEAGTQKIKGINATSYGTLYNPVIVYDDVLYYSCYDSTHGVELWRTDGSEAGTYILKEFVPEMEGINLNALKIINDLLFLDINVQGQSQQWISDGTESGTTPLTDLSDITIVGDFKNNPLYTNVINNTLVFAGYDKIYNTEPMFYRMDRGDTNLDNSIDLFDLQTLAENWLSGSSSISNHWGQYSDITDYGRIDLADLSKMSEGWGL